MINKIEEKNKKHISVEQNDVYLSLTFLKSLLFLVQPPKGLSK